MIGPARHGRGGLRLIALFEGAKGVLILAAGFGLLSLAHHDLQHVAEQLVRHFHLNPASRYPRIFIELSGHLTDARLWGLALLAFAYACMRIGEAWGLWHARRWAEWLAVASGGLYIPIEVYELVSGFSWLKAGTLAANIGIVIYMAWVLRNNGGRDTTPDIAP